MFNLQCHITENKQTNKKYFFKSSSLIYFILNFYLLTSLYKFHIIIILLYLVYLFNLLDQVPSDMTIITQGLFFYFLFFFNTRVIWCVYNLRSVSFKTHLCAVYWTFLFGLFKGTIFKTKLLIPSFIFQSYVYQIFPQLRNANSILPIAQIKSLVVIIICFFPSNKIKKSYILYFNTYSESYYFSLLLPLPISLAWLVYHNILNSLPMKSREP